MPSAVDFFYASAFVVGGTAVRVGRLKLENCLAAIVIGNICGGGQAWYRTGNFTVFVGDGLELLKDGLDFRCELAALVCQIRAVERALGSAEKRPTDAELPVRELVRRSVTTARDLPAGIKVSANDLCLLRPGTGIAPRELVAVVGRLTAHAIPAGTTLQWSDFA